METMNLCTVIIHHHKCVRSRTTYVYGQTIRGADAEFKAWVLSGGYKTETVDDDGEKIPFKHK